MANNRLLGKLTSAVKQFKKTAAHSPWSLVSPAQIPYDATLYASQFRIGTMPTAVKLYYPILKAVEMYKGLKQTDDPDFFMVSKSASWTNSAGQTVRGKEYFLELLFNDGTGTVYYRKGDQFRISNMDDDGTNGPALEFGQMTLAQLAGVYLIALPEILELDTGGKIKEAIDNLAQFFTDYPTWASDADIPDLARESAFYLDAIFCYSNDLATWSFSDNTTAAIAEQVDDGLTSSGFRGAEVICSNNNVAFRYAASNGNRDGGSIMTIAEAKVKFAAFSSHRQWNAYEQMMIPYFADNAPVMAETIKMANAILGTRYDTDPICQILWRGVTGYGKSTGVRQLACILNMPLLIQTCFPNMEITDFKSNFVPASESEGLEVDAANISFPKDAEVVSLSPLLAKAVAHVSKMERVEREAFLSGTGFYMDAIMCGQDAVYSLLGNDATETLETEELLQLYTDTVCYFREKPLRLKIAHLETEETQEAEEKPEKKDNAPAFKHIMSNYLKALVNGYLIEIQEASRIRDAGVLVGLNEYDKAGAVIHLSATRS